MASAKQIFSSIQKYNSTAFLICIALFAFAFNAAAISAQDKKPFKIKEVISKIKENSAEENGQKLVKEICERGVDFALTAENEKYLGEAGVNDLLIKVIREEIESRKEKESLYELYTCGYSDCGGIEKLKRAVKAGRDYLDKFENSVCSQDDPLIPYFKENLPILEQAIKDEENPKTYTPEKSGERENIERFSDAVTNKNWETVFITGAKIFEYKPKFLDVAIILAKVGYEQAVEQKQKSKYDEKTIYYAELAIKLMEKGEKSETGNYGANFGRKPIQFYQYKTDKFPDGRANALGWMNYIVGYVKYLQLDQKDEAIPYFKKSTQYKSEVADFPETYTIIGDWNFGKFVELTGKSSNSGETDAEKQFAERAVAAYKKAYDLAKPDSKADILEKLEKLSALGFGKETTEEDKQ